MSLNYKQGRLFLGSKGDLLSIIQENNGHACYVYDLSNIETRYKKLTDSLSSLKTLSVHYALKANSNNQILKKMKSMGSQVDVVSMGEMKVALKNGFLPQDVIFSGVAKSKEELEFAIDQGIKQINVESPQELIRIGEISQLKNKKTPVALRMNPEVNPITHPYITTGMSENKFGMDRSFLPELLKILEQFSSSIQLRGLTMHIGSQLLDLLSMDEALKKLLTLYNEIENSGYQMQSLDIGGGVGIHYTSMDEEKDFKTIQDYGKIVCQALKDYQGEVLIEPGRVLVGRSGALLCQIEYIKQSPYKTFVIVNTGMHHLMRPALYQAYHNILPLSLNDKRSNKVYDIVGPICESTDFLAKNRPMKEVYQSEFLAIADAGAYGYSMANNYNIHELPQEIVLS